MRVTKAKAKENRTAILEAASCLFRKNGVDGVGVAKIAKEAGLTHGALYAHFPSKDALVAAAFSYGFERSMQETRAWAEGRDPSFGEYMEGLLSERVRDKLETGCPMTASASEGGRQNAKFSTCFARAFEEMVSMVEASLEDSIPPEQRRSLAVASIASQMGAIAVSRAIAKSNSELANEVLQSVRKTVTAAHEHLSFGSFTKDGISGGK